MENNNSSEKLSFEDALNKTGLGKYNIYLLVCCSLLILSMYIDIFGFSIVLTNVACDLDLTTSQQGLLSAIPLIGVMLSSYAWGLCADTLGRQKTLLLAMPVSILWSLAASLAPTFISLALLKFLSAAFSSSANAAAFVLVGESVPSRYRNKFMFLMASATMFVQLIISIIALPVLQLSFNISLPFIHLYYRPWRLLLQLITLPGIIGTIGIIFLQESPKFLLSIGLEKDTIEVIKNIYKWNKCKDEFVITSIHLKETTTPSYSGKSLLVRIWNQTVPLFRPPLLKNSLKLYYILLCAYMTSTGFTMWVPTMTNAYFNGNDNTGKTFCEVASTAASNNSTGDCSYAIQPMTLYATMCYSGISGSLNIMLTFLVGPLGKKTMTVLIFTVATLAGVTLFFVKEALASIAMFFLFLYVALILGNVNTYLVELNPTHLRGMATCLSVVVARGFGFISVQVIATLLADHCTPMIGGYVVLVISGLLVATTLPRDEELK